MMNSGKYLKNLLLLIRSDYFQEKAFRQQWKNLLLHQESSPLLPHL
jgi:hypothetical protein